MRRCKATALWYVGPGRAELRDEDVAAAKAGRGAGADAASAPSAAAPSGWSSPGRVPASEYERMRAPLMGGAFPFPVKYGYATVGRVESGSARIARPHRFQPASPSKPCSLCPLEGRVPVPARCAACARGARGQHGDRAQRGLGWRARPGRSHRDCRRRAGRPAGCLSVRAASRARR